MTRLPAQVRMNFRRSITRATPPYALARALVAPPNLRSPDDITQFVRNGRRFKAIEPAEESQLTRSLLNHLVRELKYRRWDADAERLRCLEIDDQLELR